MEPDRRIDQPEQDQPQEMNWDEFAFHWPKQALEIDRETVSQFDAGHIVYYADQLEAGRTGVGNDMLLILARRIRAAREQALKALQPSKPHKQVAPGTAGGAAAAATRERKVS